MTRKIFDISRDDNMFIMKFVEGGKVGTYTQYLDQDGVDIKRVLRPIDENTEESLRCRVTFEDDDIALEHVVFLTDQEAIEQIEEALK